MSKDDVDSALATDDTPTKVKIGDKEYTAEELQAQLDEKEQLQKKYDDLHADHSKKSAKLSKMEQAALDKVDDVLSGDAPVSTLTQEQINDLKYLNSMGVLTDRKLNQILEEKYGNIDQRIEEKLKERDNETKSKYRKEQLTKEIDDLASQFTFVDKKALANFMADAAEKYNKSGFTEGAIYATATQAARALYFDQFVGQKVKPTELPSADPEKKARVEPPKAKIIELDDTRAMGEHLRERLFNSTI